MTQTAAPVAPPKPWVCFMLLCADGTLYVGSSNRLERRVAAHCRGVGSDYVASRRPAKLVAVSKPCADRSEARRLELALKQLDHAGKKRWAEQHAVGERKAVPHAV